VRRERTRPPLEGQAAPVLGQAPPLLEPAPLLRVEPPPHLLLLPPPVLLVASVLLPQPKLLPLVLLLPSVLRGAPPLVLVPPPLVLPLSRVPSRLTDQAAVGWLRRARVGHGWRVVALAPSSRAVRVAVPGCLPIALTRTLPLVRQRLAVVPTRVARPHRSWPQAAIRFEIK